MTKNSVARFDTPEPTRRAHVVCREPAEAEHLQLVLETCTDPVVVEVATDFRSMVRSLRSAPSDVVFLDDRLDTGIGLTPVQALSREDALVSIVVLCDEAETGRRNLEQGAQDYLERSGLTDRVVERVLRTAMNAKAAEIRLREAEERLRLCQKFEAIGRLAAGVSQDFNDMLTVMLGFAEMGLAETGDEAAGAEQFRQIIEAARRARSLTRQLVQVSLRDAGSPRLLNLNVVIEDLQAVLQRSLGSHIAVRVDLATDLAAVEIDPGQVEQVLLNFVARAREAMPEGGFLTLQTRNVIADAELRSRAPRLEGEAFISLAIQDTGGYIAPTAQAGLFEPAVGDTGTGLGLATAHAIVQRVGGEIFVESSEMEGTSFEVLLPTARPESKSQARMPLLTGSERVLLVESEDHIRSVLREMLERQGYSVMDAPNGSSAIELARSLALPVDLVVAGASQPGMPGAEVASALRELNADLKVLYLVDHSDRAPELGVGEDFVRKPVSLPRLAQKVRSVLDAEAVAA